MRTITGFRRQLALGLLPVFLAALVGGLFAEPVSALPNQFVQVCLSTNYGAFNNATIDTPGIGGYQATATGYVTAENWSTAGCNGTNYSTANLPCSTGLEIILYDGAGNAVSVNTNTTGGGIHQLKQTASYSPGSLHVVFAENVAYTYWGGSCNAYSQAYNDSPTAIT